MIKTPDKDNEYHFPFRYNKYLIEQYNIICSKHQPKNGNLDSMIRFGRHNGEIMRSEKEYISLLRYEADMMMTYSNRPSELLSYEEFIRDCKINEIIT